MKTAIRALILGICVILNTQAALSRELFSSKIIEKAKKGVVSIEAHVSLKAYGPISRFTTGTGCVVDKLQGIVLTNRHVVDHVSIATYDLTFHNGHHADAKLLYYDPWLDYAFLKVAPEDLPEDVTEIEFINTAPKINQPVFVVGNNEQKAFSVHTGNVSSLYEIAGSMSQHSINLSLNTKGGSSGSPILNQKGKAVGLNYAGSETFGIGLHPAYIRYALSFVKQGKIPVRKHMGAITESYSLNDGVKYRNFPKKKVKEYIKKFPAALSSAIQVTRTLQGSPAPGKLHAGDIIWAIDGQVIGPNLIALDMAMNRTEASQVCLTICRDGKWLDVEVPLYDLEVHTIKRMVSFGGALFFETDDIFSEKVGLPAGTLTFSNAQTSSTFVNVIHFTHGGSMHFGLKLSAIDGAPINNLDQLFQHIPRLVAKKHFTLDHTVLIPLRESMSELFGHRFSQQDTKKADIEYDSNAPEPKLFTFNREKMEWESQKIVRD